jgi:photosystem II stability/assembly factor-like uncharacterized protein
MNLALLTRVLTLLVGLSSAPAQEPSSVASRLESWAQHQEMAQESPLRATPWVAVGPTFQGGRIEAIAWPQQDPDTVYLGVGSGGVFKTTDAGEHWKPIFDEQSTTAIGSIAVAPSDPKIVWVGTGETHPSGTSFPGMGIFKSEDAGASWRNMGLHDSHHISAIVVHPEDPNVVYASSMGHHRSNNVERGIFKSTDGGKTWKSVLFISDSVATVDLVMDPFNTSVLYASTWDRRGDGSGIYRSNDSGENWTRLTEGLPAGADTGRVAIDLSRSQEDLLYALVVNRKLSSGRRPGGAEVYRSADGGASFKRTHAEPLDTWIGWDFCDIRIDPHDPQFIYVGGMRLMISNDAGASFARAGEQVERKLPHATEGLHLDMHCVELDPEQPGRVLQGSDGGFYVSQDRGQSWYHHNNLPIAEFYNVFLDQSEPYLIWGGTQDNASLYGPHDVAANSTGPDPWKHVFLDIWGGGDGFATLRDLSDPNIVYFEHQNGGMRRKQLSGPLLTGKGDQSIRPKPEQKGEELRFAWNTPLLLSVHTPKTLYCAAQGVFRSPDRGDSWQAISGELVPGSILSLHESARKPGLLYAAGNGGRVQMTRDDGAHWTDISAGLPEWTVTEVLASQHAEGTAYVSLSAAGRDHFDAYLFRSTDFGQTWESIAAGLPAEPVLAIAEDPAYADTLYIGTQAGVYASTDAGQNWVSLSHGFPSIPVFDLAVHAGDRDLVAATHGRSIFVLDLSDFPQSGAEQAKR